MFGLPMVDNTTFVNIIPCTMAAKHKHSNKNLGFSFKLMVFFQSFKTFKIYQNNCLHCSATADWDWCGYALACVGTLVSPQHLSSQQVAILECHLGKTRENQMREITNRINRIDIFQGKYEACFIDSFISICLVSSFTEFWLSNWIFNAKLWQLAKIVWNLYYFVFKTKDEEKRWHFAQKYSFYIHVD